MVDGSTHDVEQQARSDVAAEDSHDAGQRPRRRHFLRRRTRQPSPPPGLQAGSRQRRPTPFSAIFRVLRRLWIPLVVVAVLIAGGFTVSRLHSIFGTVNTLSYGDTKTDDQPINPKHIRYEVFGPPGTVAQISYFDEDGNPKYIKEVPVPWSLEFPITAAAGVGSIAAQGDSDSLGCRILVDNVVKSETIKQHAVSTFTSCMLKAA